MVAGVISAVVALITLATFLSHGPCIDSAFKLFDLYSLLDSEKCLHRKLSNCEAFESSIRIISHG